MKSADESCENIFLMRVRDRSDRAVRSRWRGFAKGEGDIIPIMSDEESYQQRKQERSKLAVALHEAGHTAIARHYGYTCRAVIKQEVPSETWRGNIKLNRGISSYRLSVVCWAGPIVDYLRAWPFEEWPSVSSAAFEKVEMSVLEDKPWKQRPETIRIPVCEADSESPRIDIVFRVKPTQGTDSQKISASRQKWRALKVSWGIVVEQRFEIQKIAADLMGCKQPLTYWSKRLENSVLRSVRDCEVTPDSIRILRGIKRRPVTGAPLVKQFTR